MIKEYGYINGKCYLCNTQEGVVMDEDGNEICTDCLFEKECEAQSAIEDATGIPR